jgi:hypothetical protein
MDRLAAAMAALLRLTTTLLPDGRREWAEAVWAEAGDVPSGWARVSWLVGGLWLVVREAGVVRRIGYSAAGIAAGTVLVWLDWHPGSANPAAPTNRATLIGIVVMLAVLPWAARPVLGPVADNRVARSVRVGGYLAVYGLLLVMVGLSRFAGSRFDHFRAFDQRNWEADMRSGAVMSAVLVTAVVGGYAVAILALSSRRISAAPATLAIGAGIGVATALVMYGLMPLGNALNPGNALVAAPYVTVLVLFPPAALVAAGRFAGRRAAVGPAADAEDVRRRHGAIAGLCAGGAAALLLNILTVATMLLLPRHVDLKWANPDPNAPHGTAFEVRMSVGDAALKYEAGLLLGPLLGLVLGAAGGEAGGPARGPAGGAASGAAGSAAVAGSTAGQVAQP